MSRTHSFTRPEMVDKITIAKEGDWYVTGRG